MESSILNATEIDVEEICKKAEWNREAVIKELRAVGLECPERVAEYCILMHEGKIRGLPELPIFGDDL